MLIPLESVEPSGQARGMINAVDLAGVLATFDELFLVLRGELTIRLDDGELTAGRRTV
jgi:ethanolamine utilization protein EutQ (cupin superfamily)